MESTFSGKVGKARDDNKKVKKDELLEIMELKYLEIKIIISIF